FVSDVPMSAVILAILAVPLVLSATFTSAIVLGRQAVIAQAVINITTTSVYVGLLIVLVGTLRFGVLGGVVSFMIAQVVHTTGIASRSGRLTSAARRAPGPPARPLLRYGLPFFPGSLTSFFSARADVYLLAALLAAPSAPIGYYSLAVSIAELVFYLPN